MTAYSLTGSINGDGTGAGNKTFTICTYGTTTPSAIASGTAHLYVDGRRVPRDDATYGITENSSTTITLATAPLTGTVLELDAEPSNNSGSTTWTYDTALTTSKDLVRFYSGDVDGNDQQFADATITAMLVLEPNVKLCARALCLDRAAYYTRFADTVNGALEISNAKDRAAGFNERAQALKNDVIASSARNARPMVGGATYSQDQRMDADTDAKRSLFRVGQFDYRRNRPRDTEQGG